MKKEMEIRTLGEYLKYRMFITNSSLKDVENATGLAHATLFRIYNGYGFKLKWIIPVAKWCELSPDTLWVLLEDYK